MNETGGAFVLRPVLGPSIQFSSVYQAAMSVISPPSRFRATTVVLSRSR